MEPLSKRLPFTSIKTRQWLLSWDCSNGESFGTPRITLVNRTKIILEDIVLFKFFYHFPKHTGKYSANTFANQRQVCST